VSAISVLAPMEDAIVFWIPLIRCLREGARGGALRSPETERRPHLPHSAREAVS
jgi:hypothetical protein